MSTAAAEHARQNYIAGTWRSATTQATYEKRSPMRRAEIVARVASSGVDDVDEAITTAQEAFRGWAALPMAARALYLERAAGALERRAEQTARDMAAEMGKPLREGRGEVARAVQILRYAASEAYRPVGESFEQAATGAAVRTHRRPLGVVALIAPWNLPCAIPVWKLAPALIYGNTVVLKLAYESPLSGLHIAAAFAEAELPAGVLNVLTGRGSVIGAALVHDPRVRAVSFTGSAETGSWVRDEATHTGKRVQLELGGQNPLLVMADADLDRAVEGTFAGAYFSAGQKCTATRRIYVQDQVYDAFRERLLVRIERARVGDPADPDTEVGPLVCESQFEEVAAAIQRGLSEGGRLVAGGTCPDPESYLIAPTLFEGVADEAFLSREEVFGPVASLYQFATLDEAICRANDVRFGLSAAIFTSSLAAATRFQEELHAGLLHVNSQTAGADIHVPFGGIKASGFGPHEQGRAALEFYTDLVTVYSDI